MIIIPEAAMRESKAAKYSLRMYRNYKYSVNLRKRDVLFIACVTWNRPRGWIM